jgi:hypothetical protein
MTSGLVKWDDRSRNSRGEDGILDHGWEGEKPGNGPEEVERWKLGREVERPNETDAELRKHRDQKGLETPVVYAVNDVH